MSGATILLGMICLAVAVLAVIAEKRVYTTKYDNVDVEAVIRNERLLDNYVGCLLDIKPCTPDAAELKANLPDALANDCASCSAAQKRMSDKLSHHLIDHRPEDWSLLEAKYDPTGAYRERYLGDHEDKDKDDRGEVSSTPDRGQPDAREMK